MHDRGDKEAQRIHQQRTLKEDLFFLYIVITFFSFFVIIFYSPSPYFVTGIMLVLSGPISLFFIPREPSKDFLGIILDIMIGLVLVFVVATISRVPIDEMTIYYLGFFVGLFVRFFCLLLTPAIHGTSRAFRFVLGVIVAFFCALIFSVIVS